jgi:hypothetical protein
VSGELPRRFEFRRAGDRLRLELDFTVVSLEDARRLADRVAAIPTVQSVDLALVSRREARAA